MRLVTFDYFRGIAILFIVIGHSYGPWQINSFGERVFANLIAGGSVLFVFISGFFFHYVFYEKFNFKVFLEKKAKNVFLPYLILSAMGIAYYLVVHGTLPYANKLGAEKLDSWLSYIETIAIYLWTGRVIVAYWYVPFIMIIFILSPLFVRYIKLSALHRIYIFLIWLAAAMFIHRPADNLSPLHSLLYFMPIYMLGIICSIHREAVIEFIRGKALVLGFVTLFLAILQALLHDGYGNFHKAEIFSYNGIDIVIIQKIAMCFFFLSVLQKYEGRNIPALRILAATSFAIYFIHPWILKIFSDTGLLEYLQFLTGMGVFIVTVPLTLMGCLLVAYMVKWILKKNSRFVIGW